MKEVDIVIDERLPVVADGSGKLLASRPSADGELWACYLEKAIAVHSGGWDKIHGKKNRIFDGRSEFRFEDATTLEFFLIRCIDFLFFMASLVCSLRFRFRWSMYPCMDNDDWLS